MDVFYCYNKSEQTRKNSSSGGVYPLIAEWVIRNNGIVYAAAYTTELMVNHVRCSSLSDIEATQGSKYIESELGDTFRSILADLNVGKLVLFVGTPCQCAGLRSFLGKNHERLLCVDFVCQGVPSGRIWKEYLKHVEKNGKRVACVNMRDKSTGWSHYKYSLRLSLNDGTIVKENNRKNPYLRGYISCLYLRPSCYYCQFKGVERETDITLGDGWGVWNCQPGFDDNKGCTLLMVNSSKGYEVFNEISNGLTFIQSVDDSYLEYNNGINNRPPIVSVKRRELFFSGVGTLDFNKNVMRCTQIPLFVRIIRRLKSLVVKHE